MRSILIAITLIAGYNNPATAAKSPFAPKPPFETQGTVVTPTELWAARSRDNRIAIEQDIADRKLCFEWAQGMNDGNYAICRRRLNPDWQEGQP